MTSERRKPQTGKQLLLRFTEGSDLRERLDKIAIENGRSTTAEVLRRLEASLQLEEHGGGLGFVQAARTNAAKAAIPASDLEARVSALETALMKLLAGEPHSTQKDADVPDQLRAKKSADKSD